jgi:hypothetical protein
MVVADRISNHRAQKAPRQSPTKSRHQLVEAWLLHLGGGECNRQLGEKA